MASHPVTPPASRRGFAAGEPLELTRPRSTWLLTIPWELREIGGVNQVVQNLFDIMEPVLGHRALLLVNDWGTTRPVFDEVDGRRTVRMTVRSPDVRSQPVRSGIAYLVALPRLLLRLRRLIATERITCINVHYPGLDALTWLMARRLNKPSPVLVLSFHGTDVHQAIAAGGMVRRLWSTLLKRADHIVVCSEDLRATLLASFGNAAAHTTVVNNGVDPIRVMAHARADPGIDLPREFILSLATIERKKGLDTLIRSFSQIAPRFAELALVIAGRVAEPEYLAELHRLRAGLPGADRIHILPALPHEAAMSALARSRALVLASRQEPFGIVILEAAVLGVPVLATTACGAVGLLGDCLSKVPADDVAALASSLERLMADEDLAADLAHALKGRVLAEFTWARVATRYTFPDIATPEPPIAGHGQEGESSP